MVLSGLDYRKLTDESLDPLSTLQPVLTSQNVLSISKLANRLPAPGGGDSMVSASAVHAAWLQKLFWKGDPQLLKRAPQSDPDYLHAYDTCAKYLDRLAPDDTVRFLDDITFSPDAAKHVSLVWSSCVFVCTPKSASDIPDASCYFWNEESYSLFCLMRPLFSLWWG